MTSNAVHGSLTMYNYGCRCGYCKQAKSEYQADRRAYWRDPANYDPTKEWHGEYTGYQYGCRCADCVQAGKDHRENRKWRDFW